MRIYAVDDEHYMLEALTEAIKEAVPQANVEGFRRAKDIIYAVGKEPCDIAFMDIQMPAMDGMALARKLLDIKKNINIIFVTGYDDYKADAMDVYASDYIMKPVTADKVRESLQHLRHQVSMDSHSYRALTFGNFALYVDGKPVTFHRKKSAELLAYLVARRGTVVRRMELTMVLYDDDEHSELSRKKLDSAIRTLRDDLKAVGAADILYKGTDGLAVNMELLSSDIFDYFKSNESMYPGQFLEQYSWSEFFKGDLI